jgi:hypothetical protein
MNDEMGGMNSEQCLEDEKRKSRAIFRPAIQSANYRSDYSAANSSVSLSPSCRMSSS